MDVYSEGVGRRTRPWVLPCPTQAPRARADAMHNSETDLKREQQPPIGDTPKGFPGRINVLKSYIFLIIISLKIFFFNQLVINGNSVLGILFAFVVVY